MMSQEEMKVKKALTKKMEKQDEKFKMEKQDEEFTGS